MIEATQLIKRYGEKNRREIPRTRVDELIELVGLESVAKRRAGTFSLGMG